MLSLKVLVRACSTCTPVLEERAEVPHLHCPWIEFDAQNCEVSGWALCLLVSDGRTQHITNLSKCIQAELTGLTEHTDCS